MVEQLICNQPVASSNLVTSFFVLNLVLDLSGIAPEDGLVLVDGHARLGSFGFIDVFGIGIDDWCGVTVAGPAVVGGNVGGKL